MEVGRKQTVLVTELMMRIKQTQLVMKMILKKMKWMTRKILATLRRKVIKLGKTFMVEPEQKTEPLFQLCQQEKGLVKVEVGVNTYLLQPEKLWRLSKVKQRRRNFSCSDLPSS